MSKFQLYEEVLIEWLPNDWREATIVDLWGDRYLVKIKDTEIRLTVEPSQIKRTKNENQFFG